MNQRFTVKNMVTGEKDKVTVSDGMMTACGCWYSDRLSGWVVSNDHLEMRKRTIPISHDESDKKRTWLIVWRFSES